MEILLYSTDDALACNVNRALEGTCALRWVTTLHVLRTSVEARFDGAIVIDGSHEDAQSVCMWLSRIIDAPLIAIAPGTAAEDRVALLRAGADDAMARPFEPEELQVRLLARLRRAAYNRRAAQKSEHAVAHVVAPVIQANLPSVEAQLFTILQNHFGSFVRAEELQQYVGGKDGPNNLRAHIFHLRRRLSYIGTAPRIETRYGYGYRLVGADEMMHRV